MGAECWINNLHFHVLQTDQIFKDGITTLSHFPIEDAETSVFLESNLQHTDEGEINMFSIGVQFLLTTDWPIPAFVVKPMPSERPTAEEGLPSMEMLEGSDPTESVAHAVGVLLNLMIDSNIPHNLMIADKGERVFLIPRKFDMLINAANFSTEYTDVCGLVKCKNESTFGSVSYDLFDKFLRKEVAIDTETFNKIKTDLVAKFEKEYHCTKYD